jgi:Flp pilus assembly protein TadG
MTRRQRGVTTIGWIFLLVPIALVLYAGIRVGPNYLDYFKVVTALKEVATALKSDETLAPQNIIVAVERKFTAQYVNNIAPKDVQVKKGDNGWEMTIDYEEVTPMFGNLSILTTFNKTVVIN